MAVARVLLLAAVLLRSSSAVPACPESCTCLSPDQLKCSSSGLSFVPQPIPDSVTELDLSDNLLDSVTLDQQYYNLRNVWLGNNSITHLSLCTERSLGGRYVTGRRRALRRRGCVSWAPSLQLLSAERNHLEQLPEGLEGSGSLQVLQLSFNRISTLRPGQLGHLQQLKELHLQHNLITSLHPEMFKDLAQLQVLDLSFNMLTSLHPLMYFSLHNIGASVQLVGNRWKCDCSMRSLRKRMVYDNSRGLHAWSVVCASPSNLSGRDLLQLEEDDLNCLTSESRLDRHQDVTVLSGSKILLSCSTQDSMGWTPSGRASVSQPEAGLFIKDIKERDTGLYVCVSEEQEVVSVFNLQISKVEGAQRKARSVPESSNQIISPGKLEQERNQRATQSDLALAVCLSILFSFLVAFILGVLARPCIDGLWKRVTKKKSATVTNTVSTLEQNQYDNEAYCDIEGQRVIGTHRERRVTFSDVDIREDANVSYYDTVASGDQESINSDSVFKSEAAEARRKRAGDSESDSSLEGNRRDRRDMSGDTITEVTHNIELERIQGPVEPDRRRHSTSSSDSSLSERGNNEEHMTQRDQTRPKSTQLVEESVQQRANVHTVSGVSIESTQEIPGFSSEPFAGWSPHADPANLTDPNHWQGNEEEFEFSDSVPSPSPRTSSVIGSFNDSKPIPKQKKGDTSSSSSCISEDETTHYTVNSDKEEEVAIRPSLGLNQGEPGVRKAHSSSSSSSDSDEEGHKVKQAIGKGVVKVESDKLTSSMVTAELDNREKVKPLPSTRRNVPSLAVTTQGKGPHTGAPSPPATHSSSSSSESEAENKHQNKESVIAKLPATIPQTARLQQEKQWPALDLENLPRIKRRLDIKAKSPDPCLSSIRDTKRPGKVVIAAQKTQAVPKSHSDSSSSSDSEDESTKPIKKQDPGQLHTTRLPLKESITVGHNQESGWPVLNLEHMPRLKRRLDIKTHINNSGSSSSSDSEDGTRVSIKRPGRVDMANKASQKSQAVPSHQSDSSSSSDSEEDSTKPIKKQELGQVNLTGPPLEKSPTSGNIPQTQWPLLDFEHTTSIKRRLDFKVQSKSTKVADLGIQRTQTVPSPHSDSSSSSDSEDDSIKTQDQGQLHTTSLPLKGSQTAGHSKESDRPVLIRTPRIKRRLDIKAKSPDSSSSSSSDSEDETQVSIKSPGKVDITNLEIQKTQTVLKSHSDSSSSSDSEEDFTKPKKKPEQGQLHTTSFPLKESITVGHDQESGWPILNLEHVPRIKRRLDIKTQMKASESSSSSDSEDGTRVSIKRPGRVDITNHEIQKSQAVPSPQSDSSSSSDSEEDSTKPIKKQELGQVNLTGPPLVKSPTSGLVPQTQWPLLDLEHTTSIKRRLDFKVQSQALSSSSSDSEDDTTNFVKKPTKVADLGIHGTQTVPSPHSDSSSSSDSEDDSTKPKKKQDPGQLHTSRLPLKESITVGHDQKSSWPVLNLEHVPRIKRRLDIKVRASESSSSSNSEDETRVSIKRPGRVDITNLEIQKSQTEPSPHSDSSSSSDSEDESTKSIRKLEQGQLQATSLPPKGPQTAGHDQKSDGPVLNLEHVPRIKRRLDIKAQTKASESSSSSDSEDETRVSIKRPGRVDITNLEIQKSQTVPKSHSDSSSSSDSEDDSTKPIKKQELGQVNLTEPLGKSPTSGNVPKTQWPLLDLGRTTSLKRRLDIKVQSQAFDSSSANLTDILIQKSPAVSKSHSASSSSSDSEDDFTKPIRKPDPGQLPLESLPLKGSQSVGHQETSWPVLNLGNTPRIKRRLDFKVPKPAPESSSSSDSEDETNISIERQGRLDNVGFATQKTPTASKSHSDSSSSSDSEDDSTKPIQQQYQIHPARPSMKESMTLGHVPQTQWPLLDLQHTTRVKKRLDIKVQSPLSDSSSSSDSEDEARNHPNKQGEHLIQTLPDPSIRWHGLGSTSAPHVKSESSSSSDESEGKDLHLKVEERTYVRITSRQPGSVSPDLNMSVPAFKPHLNTNVPGSRLSASSTSTSESEDENRKPTKLRLDTTAISMTTEKEFIESPKSPVINIPLSPKTDPHIKLEKYKVITKESASTTPEINPELESRWATMTLGVSRFRKRLEITSRAPGSPKVPSSPPPVSPSSSSSESGNEGESGRRRRKRREVGAQGIKYTESSPKPEITPATVSLSFKDDRFGAMDLKESQPQRESSSSSDSENDLIGRSVPDLSLGVPRIKRRLNVMAPIPEPRSSSSSSSDSETKVTGSSAQQRPVLNMPQYRDTDTLITYKRSIFQATSPTSSSPPFGSQSLYGTKQRYSDVEHESRSASVGAKKNPSRSFDELLKKMVGQTKRTTELPPELKWTGVGRHMPDLSVSSPGRRLDVELSSPPAVPELPPPDSSSSSSSESDDEIKQDRGTSNVTSTHKYSSLSNIAVSSASVRTFDTVDNASISTNALLSVSEERRERKGLSALKAMSSDRQKWDVHHEYLDNSADFGPKVETSFHYQRSEEYIPQPRPKTYLSSASLDEGRATDISYGVPSYRRHAFGNLDPLQETPPPIPATPPPSDEALGLTWGSRPNSWKQRSEGTGYYVRQSRYTVGTDPSSVTSQNLEDYFDISKEPITEV